MIGGRMALTAWAFTALAIAIAAAWAAVLTGVILSPTAASVGPKRTMRYGSTAGDMVEWEAMALMALRARSRAFASFLFASCFLRVSTALDANISQARELTQRVHCATVPEDGRAVVKNNKDLLCWCIVLFYGSMNECGDVVGGLAALVGSLRDCKLAQKVIENLD